MPSWLQAWGGRVETVIEPNTNENNIWSMAQKYAQIWAGLYLKKKTLQKEGSNADGRIRTCNRRFRRPVLYPIELHPLGEGPNIAESESTGLFFFILRR